MQDNEEDDDDLRFARGARNGLALSLVVAMLLAVVWLGLRAMGVRWPGAVLVGGLALAGCILAWLARRAEREDRKPVRSDTARLTH